MSPRYISPTQARLAVEAAGLDSSRPLDEQLGGDSDLDRQVTDLTAKVATLTEALEAKSQPATPEESFARGLADKLAESQTKWYTSEGDEHV